MSLKERLKHGYTLTELVIVMIVVAAVVSVSVKITKAKLDSIVSYTYYTAYMTLRSTAGEMIAEDSGMAMINTDGSQENVFTLFLNDLNKQNKIVSLPQNTKRGFLNKFIFQPANAIPNPDPPPSPIIPEEQVCTIDYEMVNGVCKPIVCKQGYDLVDGVCKSKEGNVNLCLEGEEWNGTVCAPIPTPTPTPTPTPETPPASSTDCLVQQVWNETLGRCVSKVGLLPKDGRVFCEKFAEMINMSSAANCSGGNAAAIATAATSGDFSTLTADIELRNGMRFYNVKNNPVEIADLAGAPTNTNTGYIVYVDLDGQRGESILWEDVFPFYVTISGRVLPAFQAGIESGGNSSAHLAVSVSYNSYPTTGEYAGNRVEMWMAPKSTSFQNAACMSGFIEAPVYCAGALPKQNICNDIYKDCQINPIKPMRIF